MSWLEKLTPSQVTLLGDKKKAVPEGLWTKCEGCSSVLYRAELERTLEVCPKCGHHGETYVVKGARSKPSKKHPEGVERHGLRTCKKCRKQFTVRVGTIFEDSKIPLHKWLMAINMMCAGKAGISSHELARQLDITQKSAWFVEHRIADPHFLRILRRFLKAGIMEDGAFVATDTGTPQGGLVSPVLSNIYLHYVLDLWFEKRFRKTCQGEAHLVRYADDFLACFAHQADAERFLN